MLIRLAYSESLVTEGEYGMDKVPDCQNKYELKYERREMLSRKRNIMVRDIRTVGRGIGEEIEFILESTQGRLVEG